MFCYVRISFDVALPFEKLHAFAVIIMHDEITIVLAIVYGYLIIGIP